MAVQTADDLFDSLFYARSFNDGFKDSNGPGILTEKRPRDDINDIPDILFAIVALKGAVHNAIAAVIAIPQSSSIVSYYPESICNGDMHKLEIDTG
jgi:hypothetical protein